MCRGVTRDSQGEKQTSKGYAYSHITLSAELSPNKLNAPHVSNSSPPALSLYLLQLGFHLSCSAETTLIKVIINNPQVAESHDALSVHIILHESTAFTKVTHFLSTNALSSLGFQDTRLSGFPDTLPFQVLLLDSSSSRTLNIGVPKSPSSVTSLQMLSRLWSFKCHPYANSKSIRLDQTSPQNSIRVHTAVTQHFHLDMVTCSLGTFDSPTQRLRLQSSPCHVMIASTRLTFLPSQISPPMNPL